MTFPAVAFSQPDLAADSEVKIISFAGLGLLIFFGFLGYVVHLQLHQRPTMRLCVLGAMGLPMIVGPLVILNLYGPLRSKMAHFALSFFGVVAGFRWLELILGTGPKGFDKSCRNFVIYFASPAEVLFDDAGQLQASKDGLVSELLLRIGKHMLIGTVALSLGKATEFAPFLDRDPVTMPLLGFPTALPAMYLQTVYVYCTLATAMLMHRLLPAFLGFDSVDSMQSPLLLSTSLRDFWGRRWNLVVHRLMKRTFFVPVAGRSRWFAGFLAFLMSGLFHEYMWLAVNWNQMDAYVPGLSLIFFLLQFLLCGLEAALSVTTLGMRIAELPQVVRTVLTTLVILPFGPLFLQGICQMGVEAAHQGQTISFVPADGSSAISGAPPLDWMMCLLVGLVAGARGMWRKSPMKGLSTKTSTTVVAVLPTCEGA